MKVLRFLFVVTIVGCFALTQANADIFICDDFDYPDGSLSGNGGWTTHSGIEGQIQVVGGQVFLTDTQSEDVNHLTGTTLTSGSIFAAFDFSVVGAPNGGTDFEYFAHFGNGSTDFTARMDIQNPLFGGDYSVGISPTSTSEANWASDLAFSTTYQAVIGYDRDSGIASLWIDPVNFGSTSIQSTTADFNDVTAFFLRESSSDINETITIDNLKVASTFNEAIGIPEPSSFAVLLGAGLLAIRRRK